MSIANLVTVCLAVQLFMAVALTIGEATGRLRLPYSKFRTGGGAADSPHRAADHRRAF
jgi:hypothetical protein